MGICSTYQVLISGLYGGISTRYRYLVMVLNSFVVVNSFRLVLSGDALFFYSRRLE